MDPLRPIIEDNIDLARRYIDRVANLGQIRGTSFLRHSLALT